MLKPLFAAVVLIAAPAAAFAQYSSRPGSTSPARPGPTMNLANPQAQANMGGEPPNAHVVPSAGDAKRIPTPVTAGQSKSQRIPQPAKPPTSDIIR
ncbi:MAG: hypothetical protein RQ966_11805 [Acetobacteraceae bacterium]|nr:hypothetical protein [Acetobacteraceae bacterium]